MSAAVKMAKLVLKKPLILIRFEKAFSEVSANSSFLVSLDHLNRILAAPEAKGPKGGARRSYEALDGPISWRTTGTG